MRLGHLGLPVRDHERSLTFYATYFGFDPATAQTYDDGTVIVRNAEGFDLALHPTPDDVETPPFLHFGFRLRQPEEVRALQTRLSLDQIPIIDRDDEPDLVSFKCLDPDGWHIEVYWEPTTSSPADRPRPERAAEGRPID